jgi:hypothetical protein
MVLVKHLKNNVIKNFILLLSFTPNTDYNEGGGGPREGMTRELRVHIFLEMKQGQYVNPLSWSVHCNFGEGPGGGGGGF